MQAIKRFTKDSIEALQAEISDAEGNEIAALGYLDEQGLVETIEVIARGNENSPAAGSQKLETADVVIHNHPSGFLTPSDKDLAVAARIADAGVGCFIVDNSLEKVYVISEPAKKRTFQKLNPAMIIGALEKGGAIAKRLPEYESRQSQLDLMRLIIKGFNEDALVAAEAGTGVGKSFAYLLPALSYAIINDERIVISTATITLQQQLYEKDIPLVLSAMKKKVKVALIKGRGNYLCLRRLGDVFREQSLLDNEEFTDLRAILAWSETTQTGSRSDLSFMPIEGLWSRICSEADACMGIRCPERERCFVLSLRRECADARILVVNHHLLFADLSARHEGAGYTNTVVLPPYNRVIIDEAHTVEAAATSFFSKGFSRLGIYQQLGRLFRKRRENRMGLLVRLMPPFTEEQKIIELEQEIQNIREIVDIVDQAGLELCKKDGVFRLTPQRENLIQGTLIPYIASFKNALTGFIKLVRKILDNVQEREEDEILIWETRSILRRLDTIGNVCASFIEFKNRTDEVLWIERRNSMGTGMWAIFMITPIAIGPSLKDALFTPNETVICVSATLTVKDSFDYWKSRSGLELITDRDIFTGQFPSPFPYASAVLLAIPQDAPLPDHGAYRAFVDKAASALTLSAGGSALVLFTSYEALKSAYNAAFPVLQEQGIRCLKQGDDDRNRLLQTFLQDEKSVLFATDSFWEGVDAPGNTLRLVILCRLPFKSPNEPVFEARCETIEKQGGNSFMELSLPESVMKFKQGFGRLMRRSKDHGVVAVLDGRILHKRYGEYFLCSLPKTKTNFSNFETLIQETGKFLTVNSRGCPNPSRSLFER
ncbi:MAG: ATP-dependent DNA helicase DinG [Treponema sp.]|nr:ATP-dependent DNA helicase DinG [Treponema sp.]